MAYSGVTEDTEMTPITVDGKTVNIPKDVLNGTWDKDSWYLFEGNEGSWENEISYSEGVLHITKDHTVDFGENVVGCNVNNSGTIENGRFTGAVNFDVNSNVNSGVFYEWGYITPNDLIAAAGKNIVNFFYPQDVEVFDNDDENAVVMIDGVFEAGNPIVVVGARTLTITYNGPNLKGWLVGDKEMGEPNQPLKLTVDETFKSDKDQRIYIRALQTLMTDKNGNLISEGNEESGWKFYDGKYLDFYQDYVMDQDIMISSVVVQNSGIIENGTFTGLVMNFPGDEEEEQEPGVINGGTFNGGVLSAGRITGGTFEGEVINGGTIEGDAVFEETAKVVNAVEDTLLLSGNIKGGVFYGDIQNGGEVTFMGQPLSAAPGEITGGLFANEVKQLEDAEERITFHTIDTTADLTMNGEPGQKFWTVEGYNIELNANVPSGQKFTKWTGAELEAVNPVTLTMPDSDVTIGFETEKVTETKPGTGETEPGTGETKPGETKPGTGETKPGETKPGTGETKPGETKPGTGETKPGETNPGTGETKPGTGETNPGTAEEKPTEEGLGAAAAVLTAVGATAVAGSGVAVLGFTAYQMGVELAAQLFLPDGASIPSTRTELALILWKAAGSPAVTLAEGETLTDTQTALRWAVDNNILSADGNEEVSKLDVLKAAYRVKNF